MSLRIFLHGARGRMGRAISEITGEQDAVVGQACDMGDDPAEGLGECDVVVDFSTHTATPRIAELAAERRKPLVIGTTGLTDAEKEAVRQSIAGTIPVVWAGNYSSGVNTLNHLVGRAAAALGEAFEAEVLEMHHHHKTDAPSGTAAQLVNILREAYALGRDSVRHGREGQTGARPRAEISVHAVRGGDIVGEHTVFFCGEGERLELTHRATDRRIFARGAVRAAHWVVGREPGVYGMEDVLGLADA